MALSQYFTVVCALMAIGLKRSACQSPITCTRTYTKIGCRDVDYDLKFNTVVDDTDPHGKHWQGIKFDYNKFNESLHSLACRCSELAKSKGYTYMSIRNFAQCVGGNDQSILNKALASTPSADCVGYGKLPCDDTAKDDCSGKDEKDYFYDLTKLPKVDGGLSNWSSYSKCDKSCGAGSQIRTRSCDNPKPQGGGKACAGPFKETKSCNIQICPVDGGLSNWSSYGKCDKSCGGGQTIRTRSCDNPKPEGTGKPCTGSLSETKSCNIQVCPVDGGLSTWSSYGKCDKSCGGGKKVRTRECNNPKPQGSGKPCKGAMRETKSCNTEICPVDGGLSKWSSYSKCDKSCGGGKKVRTRQCNNPKPQGSGKPCTGALRETKSCNNEVCPVDGGLSKWSSYSKCDKSCGGGKKVRTRECNNPKPQGSGKPCKGPLRETKSCNTEICPVDGGLSKWSSFNKCDKSCGGGKQVRTRSCNNPKPQGKGKPCSGPLRDTKPCNTQKCPVNGGFTRWSAYSACSRKCGGGVQTRTRSCTNPPPSGNGKPCVGITRQTVRCNTMQCYGPNQHRIICEHTNGQDFTCPHGQVLDIQYAMYGRTAKHVCYKFFCSWNTNCRAGSSMSKVRSMCQGKNRCHLNAANWLFGDPCCLIRKYLEVRYRCMVP